MIDIKNQSCLLLNSLNVRPAVRFGGQGPNEEVILLLRAHPVTQIFWVVNSIILLVLLGELNQIVPIFLNPQQILFLNVFSIAFILSYVWSNFLVWFFNVGIVTNERIVDIDFTNILYEDVAAAKLNKIDEVNGVTAGFFGSIFNYGNIFVKTFSDENNIEFLNVPMPNDVVLIINSLAKPLE